MLSTSSRPSGSATTCDGSPGPLPEDLVGRRHHIAVDRGAFLVGQPAGREDLLQGGVLPPAVIGEVGRDIARILLHPCVLVTKRRIVPQGVSHAEMIAQRERT